MKRLIYTMLLTLAGLALMAQTNEQLPPGSKPFSNQLYLAPDSTVWTGDVFEGVFVKVAKWNAVDSLFKLGYDRNQVDSAIMSQLADYYDKSAVDALLSDKADVSDLAGYVPTSRTINGKALTGDITIEMADIPSLVSTLEGKADLSDLDGVLRSGDDISELNNDEGYVTAATAPVTSVNSKVGDVVIDKGDLGLGNVDNTSDANKPISDAAASALADRELMANKRTSLATPNNTTYPTTQAVQEAIDAIEPPEMTGSNGIDVDGGDISPVYGTSSGTVAQGNDSRINNGQTAFGWGNHTNRYIPTSRADAYAMPSETSDLSTWTNTAALYIPTGNPSSNLPWASAIQQGVIFQMASSGSSTNAAIALTTGGSGYNGNMWFRNRYSNSWNRVWSDADFNIADYLPLSQKGVAGGVASLDGSGKVPTSQLPTTGMQYQGTWNANTNNPTLSNATGIQGHFYPVTTAGTQNLGSGNITFSVGDDVIHDGSVWQRAPSGNSESNLALGTRTGTTMPITNSNGSGLTLPAATTSLAGLLSAADKSTLNDAITEESDPTVPGYVKNITSGNISNWENAYSWGNPNGRFLSIGSADAETVPIEDLDFDSFYLSGVFRGGNASSGLPWSPTSTSGTVIQMGGNSSSAAAAIALTTGGSGYNGNMWFRNRPQQPWYEVWHSGNFAPSEYLTTSNFTWANLSGKPSTFTPSAHTHSGADITSGTIAVSRLPVGTGSNQVAAGNHGHTLSGDVTGGISNTTISNSSVTFGKIQNIGSGTIVGRAASGSGNASALTAEQVRSIINVANGATANQTNAYLLNRANHTGSQSINTVSGLQAALDDKLPITGGAITRTTPGWPNATNDDPNNYINARMLSMISGNNGLHFFGNGNTNARRFGIQSAHWNSSFSSATGTLELNPFGGDVLINGNLAATLNDMPTVNNGTLSLSTGAGLSGSTSFSANQSGNNTFNVSVASTHTLPTNAQVSNYNQAFSYFLSTNPNQAPNTLGGTTNNVNNVSGAGIFNVVAAATGTPFSSSTASGTLINMYGSASNSAQLLLPSGGSGYTNEGIWWRPRQSQNWQEIWHSGNFNPSDYAQFGTGGSQVRTNSQLDARYLQSVSGGSGVNVSGSTVSVDNTVIRTTGNQTKSGNLSLSNNLNVSGTTNLGGNVIHTGGVISTTNNINVGGGLSVDGASSFSSPVVAPQYQGTSTTASSSIPTNAQSVFTASVSSNTTYTLTNLSGNPRHIQVIITNTSTSNDVFITFNGAKLSVSQSNRVDAGHTAIFTFLIANGTAYGTKTLFQND